MRALVWLTLTACLLAMPAQGQIMGKQARPRSHAESVAPTTQVRSLYVLACAGCHGMDGAGSPLGRVPDMRAVGQFLAVPGGRAFILQVPGVMGSGLNDRQVADVTNWVLANLARGSAPDGSPPYDEAEVRAARAHPLVDVAASRAALVSAAKDLGIQLASP